MQYNNPQLDPSKTNLLLQTFNRFSFLFANLRESHAVHCPQKTSIGKIREGVFNESNASPHTAAELEVKLNPPKWNPTIFTLHVSLKSKNIK